MCTGIELGLAALTGASALFGKSNKSAPPPPPVVMPETPKMTARNPNADVKVGDTAAPQDATATPQYDGFSEKRTFGKPLGGLGRGGLGL